MCIGKRKPPRVNVIAPPLRAPSGRRPAPAAAAAAVAVPAIAVARMSGFVNAVQAARHEALVLRLQNLQKPVETLAARRPAEPVGAEVARLAADLLFEADRLAGARRRGALPMPAPDYAGLAAQLGQALAALEAFETRHTVWDAAKKAFCWSIAPRRNVPVQRLRPELAAPADPRESTRNREDLYRMMKARDAENYERGLADGRRQVEQGPEQAG